MLHFQILWKKFIDFIKVYIMSRKEYICKINLLILIIFCNTISLSANFLQDAIDNASIGSTLMLSKGVYRGKLIIDKPLSIIGKESGVIIEGDNTDDVITIQSSNVTLENLTIVNSGKKLYNLDSAVLVENVNNCQILKCTIRNSLYGINLKNVNNSLLEDNYITSNNNVIGLKGDGLKIWYSNNNIIKNNTIEYTRDATLTYSHNNKIINNKFLNNRFGLHISKSKHNFIENNIFQYNSVALMNMNVQNTQVIKNIIQSSKGAAGIGVVIAGSSDYRFEYNKVSFNAQGLYIDSKNTEEQMQRYITNNEISYNGEALHFHEAIKNNTITNNKVFGNIDDVVKDVRGIYPGTNNIKLNYWDRYAGFDSDGNNIGDSSYFVYQYADQLWHYNRKVKFFYGSPIMSLLNFLTNLAPFVEPVLLLEDTQPIVNVQEQIN